MTTNNAIVERRPMEKDLIKKDNRVIEGYLGGFDANTFKLLLFICTDLNKGTLVKMDEGYKMTFQTNEFLQTIDYNSASGYSEIRKHLQKLRSVTITLPILSEDGTKEIGYAGVGFIDRFKVFKRGEMTVYISDEMMPYLYEFNKNGTTILKYNLMKLFDSYHSLRIYELLMRWQNTDHKKVTIELEDLKEKLGVKNKYKLFAEFERNTLTVAKKEINEKSDILMDYKKLALGEAKGKGRKPITHIEFSFKFKQVKEAEELLTDKQIVELTKLCVERVKDTDKAPMALYDWAFAQTKEKVNNKKGFYKYMKAILEGDIAIFLGQLTMNLTPEKRARKKAEDICKELTEEERQQAERRKMRTQELREKEEREAEARLSQEHEKLQKGESDAKRISEDFARKFGGQLFPDAD